MGCHASFPVRFSPLRVGTVGMEKLIRGLHHVTATADDAQDDLDCYVGRSACGW